MGRGNRTPDWVHRVVYKSVDLKKSCKMKKKFGKKTAHAIAEKYDQRAYKCGSCGAWHCTSRK